MFLSSACKHTNMSYRIATDPITCFYHTMTSVSRNETEHANAIQGTVLSDVTTLPFTFALQAIQASLFRYVSNTMMQTRSQAAFFTIHIPSLEKSRNTPFSRPAPLWCRNAHSFLCINIHFHLHTLDTFSPPCAKQTISHGVYPNLFRTF